MSLLQTTPIVADIVIQWKLPRSISVSVQRAGRCGRTPGTVGLEVLLAEPSEHGAKEIKAKKTYAKRHNLKRQPQTGMHVLVLVQNLSPIDDEATDEGLYSLVQADICR